MNWGYVHLANEKCHSVPHVTGVHTDTRVPAKGLLVSICSSQLTTEPLAGGQACLEAGFPMACPRDPESLETLAEFLATALSQERCLFPIGWEAC